MWGPVTDSPLARERKVRAAQDWEARAKRAAQLVQERIGVPVEPLTVLGGLWAPLDAVEAWLGISPTNSPAPLTQTTEEH